MSAKILVVDDEADLQELMKRKFRREIRHGEFEFHFDALFKNVSAAQFVDVGRS